MSAADPVSEFTADLSRALADATFVKLTLARGMEEGLRQAFVRQVQIRGQPHASILYRYETKDVTTNYPVAESAAVVRELLEKKFKNAHLFTLDADVELRTGSKGQVRLSRHKATFHERPPSEHNRVRRYVLDPKRAPYLVELGLVTAEGKVRDKQGDKYRQVQNVIKLLDGLVEKSGLPEGEPLRLIDMGSGKGYLTFALHDYLTNHLGRASEVIGVDNNEGLMTAGNAIVDKLELRGLKFIRSSVAEIAAGRIDILLALHACDTATDEAIHQGIRSGAAIIMVVPCCQKELRPQFKPPAAEQPLFKHDTFKDRFSQMLTDGLRGLLMESRGYRTRVIEFISDAHTHRNVMIIGVRDPDFREGERKRSEVQSLKARYGIEHQALETLLGG